MIDAERQTIHDGLMKRCPIKDHEVRRQLVNEYSDDELLDFNVFYNFVGGLSSPGTPEDYFERLKKVLRRTDPGGDLEKYLQYEREEDAK
jgi:hypothetical protein